jgi:cytochrome b pre-mRNA-processing protein 3
LIESLFRPKREAAALYAAIVAKGREPHWYLDGGVADSVDGRFDMIAAVLCLVLLRLEGDPDGPAPSAHLAERFVDDMDGQLRQIGIGDIVVGKHIGRMMGMLGGRLGAYRAALDAGDLDAALVRNLYRGEAPAPDALAHVRESLLGFRDALARVPTPALIAGELR